jgi:membrane protease YdiL (CAAX protease family)
MSTAGPLMVGEFGELMFQGVLALLTILALVIIGPSTDLKKGAFQSFMTFCQGVAILQVLIMVGAFFTTSHWTTVNEFFPDSIMLEAVSMIVLAPIIEEWLFRGVLFRGLRRFISFWPAAVVSAVIFAAYHAHNNGYEALVYICLVGIIAAWLRERTGSLVPSILFHAFNNTIAFNATTHVLSFNQTYDAKQVALITSLVLVVNLVFFGSYVRALFPTRTLHVA